MMETGMQSAGVNQMGHPQLFNVAQALKVWVIYQVIHQFGWYADEPVNRVVYDFLFVQSSF